MSTPGSLQVPGWVEAAHLDDLAPGSRLTFREGRHQILLLRDDDGDVTAIDNRCPHEGYPLSQGDVKDGSLTCAWHNWKFRLRDGTCTLGGEDVRRYDVLVENGKVLVDLDDPPAAEQIVKLEVSLDAAFEEDDWNRAARDVERMLSLGRPLGDVLGLACAWSARHGRYGMAHGLAAAADYAALTERFPDDAGVMLLEAIHSLVEPHLRRPPQTFAAPEAIVAERTAAGWGPLGVRLRGRIEREDLPGAQALLRGAIEDDVPRHVVFEWLTGAATDHFYDYAHVHIYVVKAEELLEAIGWSFAHPVLTSLVSTMVYGTREDTLPYMRAYRSAMDARAERVSGLPSASDGDIDIDIDTFVRDALGAELDPALDSVLGALEGRVRPDRVALALGLAASERLLRFDPAIDVNPAVSEGWLHATHLVTHADAVRESTLRHPSAAATRGLFQSARFIQHAHVLDGGAVDRVEVTGDAGERLVESVTRRDPVLGTSAAYALAADDPEKLEDALLASCLATPLVRPIFVQHHVKTVCAAVRLARAARDDVAVDASSANLPLLATARFLCSPQRERRFRSAMGIARDFVRDGTMRGNLLGY